MPDPTPRERVLRRWPGAWRCGPNGRFGFWIIFDRVGNRIGEATTEQAAWEAAARGLDAEPKEQPR